LFLPGRAKDLPSPLCRLCSVRCVPLHNVAMWI